MFKIYSKPLERYLNKITFKLIFLKKELSETIIKSLKQPFRDLAGIAEEGVDFV